MRPEDRRFIAYWQDQRKGSKVGYYTTYTIGWSVIVFFVLFFFSKLFTDLWETGGPYLALVFLFISIGSSFFITNYIWKRNERRMKRLLNEEKENLN